MYEVNKGNNDKPRQDKPRQDKPEEIKDEVDLNVDKIKEKFGNIHRDAGTMAKERLKVKRDRIKIISLYTNLVVLTLITLFGLTVYNTWEKIPVVIERYERQCSIPEHVGMDIKGIRKFTHRTKTFMNVTIRLPNTTESKTIMSPTYNETMVTGIREDSWTKHYIGDGESTLMELKPADLYVFTQGSKNWVTTFDEFCK